MTMVRKLTAAAGLVAILVLLASPGGAACPWTYERSHDCCAEPVANPNAKAGGCCGEESAVDPSPAPISEDGCDCVHAPAAPAAVEVGTPTTSVQLDPQSLSDNELGNADHQTVRQAIDHVPTDRGLPPPIFLLDCAFLT